MRNPFSGVRRSPDAAGGPASAWACRDPGQPGNLAAHQLTVGAPGDDALHVTAGDRSPAAGAVESVQVDLEVPGEPAHQRRDHQRHGWPDRRVDGRRVHAGGRIGRGRDRRRGRVGRSGGGSRVSRATRRPHRTPRGAVADQHVAGAGLLLLAVGLGRDGGLIADRGRRRRDGRRLGAVQRGTVISGLPTSSGLALGAVQASTTGRRTAWAPRRRTWRSRPRRRTGRRRRRRPRRPASGRSRPRSAPRPGRAAGSRLRSLIRSVPLEVVDGVEDPVHARAAGSAPASAAGTGCRTR